MNNGHLDAAIAATPLEEEKIKEIVLYYEPFVAYISENNAAFAKTEIEVNDLNLDEILLLQDGHCFKDSIINLCKSTKNFEHNHFQLESGSFETLIKLADEGLGMTLLPYLHTLNLTDKEKIKLRNFAEPKPAREVSLHQFTFHQGEKLIHPVIILFSSNSVHYFFSSRFQQIIQPARGNTDRYDTCNQDDRC